MEKDFKNGENIGLRDGLAILKQFNHDYRTYAAEFGEEAAEDAARGYLYGLEDAMAELEDLIRG